MGIFNKLKTNSVIGRKSEEALYSMVAEEMANGERQEGLWLKALQLASGNSERQVAEYIKLRVQSLRDDIHIGHTVSRHQSLKIETQEESRANSLAQLNVFDGDITNAHDIEEFIILIDLKRSVGEISSSVSSLNSEMIKALVNKPDVCDDYPLHVALKREMLDVVEWLLQVGADPHMKDFWDKTVWEIATDKNDVEAINLFKQYSI